ncbi:hypothetical protein KQI76_03475 [Amphibacillus sp. MSJ-3]|uniref:hypothetical protein n=1 Tax=Amphibacillus sp. MSJ-3 TaxID=2841505 RepID=UPI001C0EF638|nr:hypothetical protein [Amphibacillus sp. MSJ-3]MBU5594214.1 hypothetical protein [Amphibacillus sp. MSJ-3]
MKNNLPFYLLLIISPLLISFSNKADVIVYFLELPDGEATLVRNEHNQYSLINSGSEKSRDYLENKLAKLGVKEIEILIITDQDPAYRDNKTWLMEMYNVKQVYDIKHTDQLKKAVSSPLYEGMAISLSDSLKFHVLAIDDHQTSTTSLLTYVDHAILFIGRTNLTDDHLSFIENYRVEIVKVAHFGVEFQPSHRFWHKINPHAAIIFPLEGVSPDPLFITYLDENWIDVYRLSDVGPVIIRFKGSEYDLDV